MANAELCYLINLPSQLPISTLNFIFLIPYLLAPVPTEFIRSHCQNEGLHRCCGFRCPCSSSSSGIWVWVWVGVSVSVSVGHKWELVSELTGMYGLNNRLI